MTEKQHKSGGIMRDDPLAWLTEAPGENLFEQPSSLPPEKAPEPEVAPEPVDRQVVADAPDEATDEGSAWGLFESEAEPTERPVAVSEGEDESWGLFESEQSSEYTPVVSAKAEDAGEGWGLFEASPQPNDTGSTLLLGSALMLQDVDAARAEWIARMAGDSFEIDGGEVERVDAAGMQLLCAMALSERQQGRQLCWRNVSSPLRGAAEDLGMSSLLGLAA